MMIQMSLSGRRRSLASERAELDATARSSRGIAISARSLDDESYEPLATIAHEISRELGGDGLLVTWHEDAGQPRHLFADGAYSTGSGAWSGAVDVGTAIGRSGSAATRSQWQVNTGDPASATLTTSIPGDRGVLTITALFKRVGRSTRMRASESIARLLPLVQPFFRTWLSRLRAMGTIRALTSVVNGSDIAVLLLDRAGQLTFVNSAAEELLARGDGVHRRGDVLVAGSLTDTLRLNGAIEQAVLPSTDVASRFERSIIALHRREGRSLMAAVMPSRHGHHEGERGAIVFIVDPDQDLRTLIEPVCEFYGLSPTETRLACTLVRGLSLNEAADELHVREQTARTYLKQIFSKTDTNRQVELVRLLLLSAVRTGGHRHVVAG